MALAVVKINWVFSNSVGGFTDNFVSSFLSVCLESHESMRWTWWTLNYYLPFPVVLLAIETWCKNTRSREQYPSDDRLPVVFIYFGSCQRPCTIRIPYTLSEFCFFATDVISDESCALSDNITSLVIPNFLVIHSNSLPSNIVFYYTVLCHPWRVVRGSGWVNKWHTTVV